VKSQRRRTGVKIGERNPRGIFPGGDECCKRDSTDKGKCSWHVKRAFVNGGDFIPSLRVQNEKEREKVAF